MANQVFANGMEIACKAGAGKVIAAFPDVCMTPPESPATPPGVPVPYPNTAMASDTTDGSKSVKISDKEIMLKNKSCFKTSTGDEAGATAKKGVISSKTKGKVYFIKWSMNVKIEGENVDRHLDMTTNNHGSPTANEAVPWPYIDRMNLIDSVGDCGPEKQKIKDKCGDPLDENKTKCPDPSGVDAAKAEHETAKAKTGKARKKAMSAATKKVQAAHEDYAVDINKNECANALKCALVSHYEGSKRACCPHSTPDHLVPAAQFGKKRGKAHESYSASKAPCMCATGLAQTATHGLLGKGRTAYMKRQRPKIKVNSYKKSWTVADSCKCGAESAAEVTDCSKECLEAQLRKGHENMDVELNEKICTRKESVKKDSSAFEARLRPPLGSISLPG